MSSSELESVDVCYTFGQFRLDPSRGTLTREGEPVPLTPKLYDTLLLFVENAGRVLSREMLTEALWPDTVVSDTSLTQNIFLLRKAIGEDAIKTVPRKGYRFVLPVTSGTRRKTSVALRLSGARPIVLPRRPYKLWAAIAGIVVVMIAAGWLLHAWRVRQRSAFAREAAMARKQAAIVTAPFANERRVASDAWLRTALPRMLADELAAGDRFRVAPSETAIRMPLDLHLSETTTFAPETASRIGRYSHADLILCGSFVTLGESPTDDLELTARLQDAASGEVIASATAVGDRAQLFALVRDAAADLRRQLGVAAPAPAEQRAAERLSAPANLAAAQLYARGVEELHRYNVVAARDLLLAAAKADPNYALTHRALCEVWTKMGQDANAKASAARAVELARDLPRAQQLEIEALRAQTNRQFAEAVETRRALWRFYPENADYALDLVSSLHAAANPSGALQVIRELRTRGIASDDPRVDFAEANVHLLSGEWGEAVRLADSAIAKLGKDGSRTLLCRALSVKAGAQQRMGDPAWRKNVEQALAIARSIGYSTGVIRALNTLAVGYSDDGDPDKAIPLLREAERVSIRNGDMRGQVGSLGNLVYACQDAGRWKEAEEASGRALTLARAAGDKVNESILLNLRANGAARQGRFAEAEAYSKEALARARAMSRKSGIATNLGDLARTAFITGRFAEAESLFKESLAGHEANSAASSAADVRADLAALYLEQGKIAAARAIVGSDPLMQARIALAEGDRAKAAKIAGEMLAKSPKPALAARVYALRALATDSAEDAQRALNLIDATLPYHEAMMVRIDAARTLKSRALLEQVARDTAATGDVVAQRAARRP